MNPKVFVVTVCRNAEALLSDTMRSVMLQTYSNMEYVLIDGASTDRSANIIRDFAQDPTTRIAYWVSEPDKGIYDAMNKALQWIADRLQQDPDTAEDAWVNFMNAGDAFADQQVLDTVFSQPVPATVKVIGGNTINMMADGTESIHLARPASVIPTQLPFSHQACFVRVGNNAPQVCLKKDHWHFDRDYPIAADYNLLYQTYWKHGAEAFLILNQPLARYRQEGSTSLDNAKRTKGEYLAIQSSHLNWRWVKEYLKWRWL